MLSGEDRCFDYVGFFKGNPDEKGRTISDILSWSDDMLESSHDYIQEIFPTRTQSNHANILPISNDEIWTIQNSQKCLRNLRLLAERMMDFWKMSGEDRPFWFRKNNHNCLRVSRCMECLSLFEMQDELRALTEGLGGFIQKYPDAVSFRTFQVWLPYFIAASDQKNSTQSDKNQKHRWYAKSKKQTY